MFMNLIIAFVFCAIGIIATIIATLFINKIRDRKNELKKQYFRLDFQKQALFEDIIRTIHEKPEVPTLI